MGSRSSRALAAATDECLPMGASLGASLRGLEDKWLNRGHLLDLFGRPSATKLLAAFDERCPKKPAKR